MPGEDIFYVKLEYRGGREFDMPYGFTRLHHLQHGNHIHCILLYLENKNKRPKKIGEDVIIKLYDNPESADKLRGEFELTAFESYDIANYKWALFKMKKKIED